MNEELGRAYSNETTQIVKEGGALDVSGLYETTGDPTCINWSVQLQRG